MDSHLPHCTVCSKPLVSGWRCNDHDDLELYPLYPKPEKGRGAERLVQEAANGFAARAMLSSDWPAGDEKAMLDVARLAAYLALETTTALQARVEEAFKKGWDEADSLYTPGKHQFFATVEDAWKAYKDALNRKDS